MVDYFVLTLQILHVLFAVYLIGSGFFFEFFVKPQLATLQPQDMGRVTMAIGDKFTMLVYAAWAVIVSSGLYRLIFVMEFDFGRLMKPFPDYGFVLGVKMVVVALAFSCSLLITYTTLQVKKTEPQNRGPLIKRISMLSRTVAVLGIMIISLAVSLRWGLA